MMPGPDASSAEADVPAAAAAAAEFDTNQNGPQAQQTSCTKKPIFLGGSNLPANASKDNVITNPGTGDILSAMAHNIEVLAETMQSKGQNSAADKAELDELRATLEETKRVHEENDRFRIDRFLLASAAQEAVAIQEGTDAHGSSTHSGTSSEATSSSQPPQSQHQDPAQHADADLDSDDLAKLSSAGFLDAPGMTPEAEKQDVIALSTEAEYARTYADVFGRKPATVADLEKMLDAVDSELAKLPQEEMVALNRAREALPMLCLSSRHTMIFLQATGFQPGPAAKQMARYWSKRVALYGDDAFSPGNLSLPSNEDLIRMYDKAYEALHFDLDADDEERALAATFVERFHTFKLEALTKELESYPTQRRESYLKAKELCPGRISDIDFLQSANFNVKDAAERICNYFQLYDELFGPSSEENQNEDGTFLPIAQSSFGDEQLSDLYLGFCRIMPGNDKYGRAIIFFDVSKLEKGAYSDRGIVSTYMCVGRKAIYFNHHHHHHHHHRDHHPDTPISLLPIKIPS